MANLIGRSCISFLYESKPGKPILFTESLDLHQVRVKLGIGFSRRLLQLLFAQKKQSLLMLGIREIASTHPAMCSLPLCMSNRIGAKDSTEGIRGHRHMPGSDAVRMRDADGISHEEVALLRLAVSLLQFVLLVMLAHGCSLRLVGNGSGFAEPRLEHDLPQCRSLRRLERFFAELRLVLLSICSLEANNPDAILKLHAENLGRHCYHTFSEKSIPATILSMSLIWLFKRA